MTKKDYILIATVLRRADGCRLLGDSGQENLLRFIVSEFAKDLLKDNPRFNDVKFYDFIFSE